MFNKDVKPVQPEPSEPTPQHGPERPKRKEVSPSQEGKFQRELERKEEKKEEKPTSTSVEKKSVEKEEKGLFHLAKEKGPKDQEKGKGGKKETSQQQGQRPTTPAPQQPTARTQPKVTPQKSTPEEGEEAVAISGVPVEETPDIVSHTSEETVEGGIPLEAGKDRPREAPIIPTGREAEAPVQPTQVPGEAVVRPESTQEPRETHRAELHALVEKIAETMATLVSKTDTTIVVTLKHPPLFDGASLIVKQPESAKNEFNITFENLPPQARALIETEANQAQLRQGLIEKGYTLHMVTIESGILFVNPTASESRPEGERSFEQEAGGGEGEGGDAGEQEGEGA